MANSIGSNRTGNVWQDFVLDNYFGMHDDGKFAELDAAIRRFEALTYLLASFNNDRLGVNTSLSSEDPKLTNLASIILASAEMDRNDYGSLVNSVQVEASSRWNEALKSTMPDEPSRYLNAEKIALYQGRSWLLSLAGTNHVAPNVYETLASVDGGKVLFRSAEADEMQRNFNTGDALLREYADEFFNHLNVSESANSCLYGFRSALPGLKGLKGALNRRRLIKSIKADLAHEYQNVMEAARAARIWNTITLVGQEYAQKLNVGFGHGKLALPDAGSPGLEYLFRR